MNAAAWFVFGALAATALVTRLVPAPETPCCQRVAYGARDKIAGYAGPFSGVVSGTLDALGLTSHIPSVLDALGLPKDA